MKTQKAERITEKGGNDDVTPWFGFIPASSILSRVHVVRTNFTIRPFGDSLHWTFHRFAINRFSNNGRPIISFRRKKGDKRSNACYKGTVL